jgi:hypothetical protein
MNEKFPLIGRGRIRGGFETFFSARFANNVETSGDLLNGAL